MTVARFLPIAHNSVYAISLGLFIALFTGYTVELVKSQPKKRFYKLEFEPPSIEIEKLEILEAEFDDRALLTKEDQKNLDRIIKKKERLYAQQSIFDHERWDFLGRWDFIEQMMFYIYAFVVVLCLILGYVAPTGYLSAGALLGGGFCWFLLRYHALSWPHGTDAFKTSTPVVSILLGLGIGLVLLAGYKLVKFVII